MGKSKKTLALVMALVMAFTIVPFGAWYGFKAAAEEPSVQAVGDYYTPAIEFQAGKEYCIVSADGKYVLANQGYESNGDPKIVGGWDFNVANQVSSAATWTYDSNGCFSQVYEGQVRYLDFYSDGSVHPYGSPDCKLTVTKVGGAYDNAYRIQRNGTERYLKYGGSYNFVTSKDSGNYVLLFEKDPKPTAQKTIELPITIRDFHTDDILVMKSMNNAFTLTHDGTSGFGEGTAVTKFLNLAGTSSNYRTGLMQSELKDGKVQYSPYVVIYLAHVLREGFYGSGKGWKDGNCPIQHTPLGKALMNKFSASYTWRLTYISGKETWHHEKMASDGSKIEAYLYHNGGTGDNNYGIQGFYSRVYGNEALKTQIDSFFENCKSYTKEEEAREALGAINGLAYQDIDILVDYWRTISHATVLKYENIVNDNPYFETGKQVYVFDDFVYQDSATNHMHLADPYTVNGASLMDVSWYMLHHLFEDDFEAATSLSGNSGSETNFEYFSKTVDNAAPALQLKRIVKADGSVSYVYDSAYTSDWGDVNTPISNEALTKDKYTGIKDKEPNFHPIDGDGFGNSSGDYNYGMSLHGSGKFIYHYSDDLYFDFTGDDDVYLYIDGKIALDLGGVHGPVSGKVALNKLVDDKVLDLEEGCIYDFDFFYMERCLTGSNLRMETNIEVSNDALVPQKIAYSKPDCMSNSVYESRTKVPNGKTVYYEIGVNNFDTTYGGATLNNLVLKDEGLGITISGTEVILPNNELLDYSNMTFHYAEVDANGNVLKNANGDRLEETPVKTNDPDTIKQFIKKHPVESGHALFVTGIGYKMLRSEHPTGEFTNILTATATASYSEGTYIKDLEEKTSFTMKLFDVVDKVYVMDFMSGVGVKYAKDDVFSGTDEKDAAITIGTSAKNGTLTVDGDYVIYKSAAALNDVETFDCTIDIGNGQVDHKSITFVPANNVFYDDNFAGIDYTGEWETMTAAGGVFNGISGTDVIYGNNPDFGKDVTYAGGDIHFFTGKGENTPVKVSFTFTGTGVSAYMKTAPDCGLMIANIVDVKTGKAVMAKPIVLEGADTLNSVPAVNFLGLPYGEYRVDIIANIKEGVKTYLDGIRVYLPLENDSEYYNPEEKSARFIELRDQLVSGSALTDATVDGVLYIDGNGSTDDFGVYEDKGPKNEIYLSSDNGIAFKVVGYNAGMYLQVSARTANTEAAKLSDGVSQTDITSATDMYYKVAVGEDGLVTIKNTGNGILALTNLKITGEGAQNAKLVVSKSIAEKALSLFNAPVEPETPEEPETPSKPQSPILKFFEDVRNFFNKLFGKH